MYIFFILWIRNKFYIFFIIGFEIKNVVLKFGLRKKKFFLRIYDNKLFFIL